MSDSGDSYERYFRARDFDDRDGEDPGTDAPGSRSDTAPHRRGPPPTAQQRLMARIAAGRKARQRRAFLVASAIVSALVLFVAGAGWALTGYVNHAVSRVNAGTTDAPPGAPVNILVAGVDTRAGLTRHQQLLLHVGDDITANSDTMMLVHISPAQRRVIVVSLPRDSWVDIPGHGMNKINAAYGLGGPKLMVQTVEQVTGLTINDYVEVNFLAFVKVINALGGVNICLPVALNDQASGINMPAGVHHVYGVTALEYARDRHSFPLEDLTRIQDQQSLVSTALGKLISTGTLTDPLRLAHLVGVVLPTLRVNTGLNVAALADELTGITPDDVAFLTVPLSNIDYMTPTGEDAVLWNTQEADRLFTEIGNGQLVISAAPRAHNAGSHGAGSHGAGSQGARHPHPAGRASPGQGQAGSSGWVPPGTRTAAQAACR
jgi:LCP family protein required for cell wall assembly